MSAEKAERTEGGLWNAARIECDILGGFGAERGAV